MTRDQLLEKQAQALGMSLREALKIGGRYTPAIRHGDVVHVSGQIPRVGNRIVITGQLGDTVTLDDARYAVRICTVRSLILLQRCAGSLDHVRSVLRMNVYLRCTPTFTDHSEVADAGSDMVRAVLDEAGEHARTTLGVFQLPRGSVAELDLTAALLNSH